MIYFKFVHLFDINVMKKRKTIWCIVGEKKNQNFIYTKIFLKKFGVGPKNVLEMALI